MAKARSVSQELRSLSVSGRFFACRTCLRHLHAAIVWLYIMRLQMLEFCSERSSLFTRQMTQRSRAALSHNRSVRSACIVTALATDTLYSHQPSHRHSSSYYHCTFSSGTA